MQIDRKEIIEKVLKLKDEFNTKQVDREELSQLLILSLFSKKHIFLLGEPGVSKTGALEIFSTAINSDKTFEITIKNDTKYEEIFGDTYRDESGMLHHDPKYSIVDAHIAILDECWKGNSKVMNSFLSIMSNYRTVDMLGVGPVKAPLIMAGGASNELPIDEEVDALRDRFLFNYKVESVKDKEEWIKYASRSYDRNPELSIKFDPHEIEEVFNMSQEVEIDKNIYELLYKIRQQIVLYSIGVSDRKFDNAIDALKVCAFLNNRDIVELSDLFILRHIMWKEIIDIEKINNILLTLIFGSLDSISQNIDEVDKNSKRIYSYISGALNDFLKFRQAFSHSEIENFHQKQIEVDNVIEYLERERKKSLSILAHHEFNKKVEEKLYKNHFVQYVQSPIYTVIDISELSDIHDSIEQKIEELRDWQLEYKEIYKYNSMVNS